MINMGGGFPANYIARTNSLETYAEEITRFLKEDFGDDLPEIILEPTPDILAALGAAKRDGQILVGFAAETSDVEANAREKLAKKNLDMVVANDVSAPGVGFGHATNAVTILSADGCTTEVPLADKTRIAGAILDSVVRFRKIEETS